MKKNSKLRGRRWYIAYIPYATNSDKEIKKLLKRGIFTERNIQFYYPKYKVIKYKKGKRKAVWEPLLPNYCFFKLNDYKKDSPLLKRFLPIVGFVTEDPISKKEIHNLRKKSKEVKKTKFNHLVGKTVIATKGSFRGLPGECVKLVKGDRLQARVRIYLGKKYKLDDKLVNVDELEVLN
ncbi:TPA: hypothetical protein DIC62_00360 [Candidatus Nomurabacteria bacterium]|nr:hypothetical protein [Candidatus Nomurabacteria bacterium]